MGKLFHYGASAYTNKLFLLLVNYLNGSDTDMQHGTYGEKKRSLMLKLIDVKNTLPFLHKMPKVV